MTILVTGGAGFIGTNFIQYYRAKYPNDYIICVDKQTYASNKDVIAYYRNISDDKNFLYACFDIANKEQMSWLFKNHHIDIVVNFAAETHVDRSIVDAEPFIHSNITGVQVLLDECLKYNVRFHQVSTDEVYGDLPLDAKEMLFTEQSMLKSSSPYSASKAAADLLTLAYYKTYGLSVSISRCSNNYGKFQHTEKLIPKAITLMQEGKLVPIYGNGLNVRDWIHVFDHFSAIDLIIHSKETIGQVYNVGASNERTNIEIIELLSKILNKKPENSIMYVKDRLGHDRRYAIDSSKLRALGWEPQIDFEDGLADTVEWYIGGWKNEVFSNRS